jgi:DNA-binding GntR family transcriptional regulator
VSERQLIESVEDVVYGRLREAIGGLQLQPNERLRLEELADRYGVSLTPVRQALRRLQTEGLVVGEPLVGEPRRGAHVAPLTIPELEEIQAIRAGLEGFLAREGARRCTEEALEELQLRRLEIDRHYDRGDVHGYSTSFWAFRDACYRCADRPRLLRALGDYRLRAERYIMFLCRDVDAAAQLREPPDLLLEACRRRDGEAAEASTRSAMLWVLEALQTMLADSSAGLQGAERRVDGAPGEPVPHS